MSETTETVSDRDPQRIRNGKWEQGAVIAPEDLATLCSQGVLPPGPVGACAVLLSQSCDVLAESYDDEPEVEIIVASPLVKSDWRYVKLRNPRVLHLPFDVNGARSYCELRPHLRFMVPRHLLEVLVRDRARELAPRSLRMLRTWVVDRYLRAVFPDEFNTRLKRVEQQLHNLFKKAIDVTGAWVLLDTDSELEAGEPYRIVSAIITMRTDAYTDRTRRLIVEKIGSRLGQILEGCDGVECELPEVRPEARFSLDDLGVYQRIDKNADHEED